jgi:imidazolonepropionase-like amidohydrolase
MRRLVSIPAITALAITAAIVYVVLFWPLRDPHPPPPAGGGSFAIADARIYVSPDQPPLDHAALVVRDGRVAELGSNLRIPQGVRVLDCDPCIVTAGFWNAHVHFTEPKFNDAIWGHAASVQADLDDMLLRRGLTTVVDAGSDPRVSVSLRRRIESGELRGPAIYTAGRSLYPPHGIPYYLANSMPIWIRWLMPQPSSAEAAAAVVERNVAGGTDLTKLFTGSYVQRGQVLPMPLEIARAAVDAAHRHGQIVYSHPSNAEGTKVAVAAGVDVLAHAPDTTEGVDDALIQSLVDRRMAMIPTLKMFATTVTDDPAYIRPIHAVVSKFRALGGQILFGTDVGYMEDYRTTEEFAALADCGLGAMDILRALTTAPASRFHADNQKGTVEVGKWADLAILDDDPAVHLNAFARVQMTVRAGKVVYRASR